jgi:hypothetical protein
VAETGAAGCGVAGGNNGIDDAALAPASDITGALIAPPPL